MAAPTQKPHGHRLIAASNAAMFLAAILIVVGLVAAVDVVWIVGVAVLAASVVLSSVNARGRRKRTRSS